jgi:hypothetical protein
MWISKAVLKGTKDSRDVGATRLKQVIVADKILLQLDADSRAVAEFDVRVYQV